MSMLEGIIDSRNHPLAVVEDIAAHNNWSFERSGEDEITIVSKGSTPTTSSPSPGWRRSRRCISPAPST